MRREFLKKLSLLTFAAPIPGFARTCDANLADERLLGRWRSDRGLTMQYWRLEPQTTDEMRELIGARFGKITWHFTQREFTLQWEYSAFTVPYRVVAKDATSVVVELGNEGNPSLQYIGFENNHLYILTASHNLEFFSRVAA